MAVGVAVGVGVAVADALGVADGLGVAWLDGVGNWLGVADGAAGGVAVGESADVLGVGAGWLRAAAATMTGPCEGAAAASAIPVAMAAAPPMAPTPTSSRVQEEAV